MESSLTEDIIWPEDRKNSDMKYRHDLLILIRQLRINGICNLDYFKSKDSENSQRFYQAFNKMIDHLDNGIEPGISNVLAFAHLFDIDASLPYNGYRSIITVIHKCIIKLLQLSRHIIVSRSSLLFRANYYSIEIEAYVSCLAQFRGCLHYVLHLPKYCEKGSLYPDEELLDTEQFNTACKHQLEAESLLQEPFYGRPLAFQFCDSIQNALTSTCIGLASHGDALDSHASTVSKLLTYAQGGSRYYMYPEERAKKVIAITRTKGMEYCKSFWHLTELQIAQVPHYFSPSVDLNRTFQIPVKAIFIKKTKNNDEIKVMPPCAHSGPGPVSCRLMSHIRRKGQEAIAKDFINKPSSALPSKYLIFHVHGGGFVAQSSQSHASYMRYWTKNTGAPILSVDYSLAPEFPFPRAFEECFFAYVWALKNNTCLGWTGEKIVFAGDSAGANLIFAVALRAKELEIRMPDGIISLYGCFVVRYSPSPSRMMSLWDPLLFMGIVFKILCAYAGVDEKLYLNKANSSDSGYVQTDIEDGFINVDRVLFDINQSSNVDEIAQEVKPNDISIQNPVIFTLDESNETEETKNLKTDNLLKVAPTKRQSSYKGEKFRLKQNKPISKRRCLTMPTFDNCVDVNQDEWHLLDDQNEVSLLDVDPKEYALYSYTIGSNDFEMFKKLTITKNPFMSPFYASIEQLKDFCPIHFIACQMDPMLDDTIEFAKKVKRANTRCTVDVLKGIPHGFLQFAMFSSECFQGVELATTRLNEAFNCT